MTVFRVINDADHNTSKQQAKKGNLLHLSYYNDNSHSKHQGIKQSNNRVQSTVLSWLKRKYEMATTHKYPLFT